MFTGIVSELGRVSAVAATVGGRRITVEAPDTRKGLEVGDSIAVNGVCLTAVEVLPDGFAVEAVQETLDHSNVDDLAPGSAVDLERPVRADGRFDGHVVQGHVDGVGHVAAVTSEGGARRVRVEPPADLLRYVVRKGSITVDGVSLTVTAVDEVGFEFVLIPHTLDVTVLGRREAGDRVNLEVDVLAKYVERMLEARR